MRPAFYLRPAALTIVWSMLIGTSASSAQDVRFAVVINAQNSATNIPLDELRKIFLGERRFWPGSRPIKLVVRAPGSPEHKAVLKLLGMTESEFKQYWTQQVFRGEAQAEPTTVPTNQTQIDTVIRNLGAIAVVDVRDLMPGSRTVTINNLSPNDKDYPMHESP